MQSLETKENLLHELKEDLKKRNFILSITESGLEELENFYSEIHFEQRLISPDYFERYFNHLAILIGETYVRKNGGSLVFGNIAYPEPSIENSWEVTPIEKVNASHFFGIESKNGKFISGFIDELHEDIIDELDMNGLVLLMSSYSSIQIECDRNF